MCSRGKRIVAMLQDVVDDAQTTSYLDSSMDASENNVRNIEQNCASPTKSTEQLNSVEYVIQNPDTFHNQTKIMHTSTSEMSCESEAINNDWTMVLVPDDELLQIIDNSQQGNKHISEDVDKYMDIMLLNDNNKENETELQLTEIPSNKNFLSNLGASCNSITPYINEKVDTSNILHENDPNNTVQEVVGELGVRKIRKGNTRERNRELRIHGKEYIQRNKRVKPPKLLKPDPCKGKKCQHNCSTNVNDEQRLKIFHSYYKMPNEGIQNQFLASCVEKVPIKRRYGDPTVESRRKCSKEYFLPVDGKKIQVCQQFLLATLSITQKKIRYLDENKTEMRTAKPENRGHKEPKNKTPIEVMQTIDSFIKLLPAVPSHYCRAKSTKRYLPVELKNTVNLYRTYKQHCIENTYKFVTERLFRVIFKRNYNIGFHLPKKDKCSTCEGEKNKMEKNLDLMKAHLIEKEASKNLHKKEQERAKEDPSFVCCSFDLQKVLNTPYGESMLLYYSRKYSYYNHTCYESATRNVYCFLWGEQDGKRGANEICSNLCKYLKIVDDRQTVKTVSLICDSCPGQNKNHQVISAIVWFLRVVAKNIEDVFITYLLPGHTYMPVDSVHATIENKVRRQVIWAPSEWPTVIRNSRQDKPYNIIKLMYNEFSDFKVLQASIFPDNIKFTDSGAPLQFCKIRRFAFKKGSDKIKLHYSFKTDDEPQILTLPERVTCRSQLNQMPPQLYSTALPLATAKIKDLLALVNKSIIPPMYRAEYESLKPLDTVPDVLPETDEEDNSADENVHDALPRVPKNTKKSQKSKNNPKGNKKSTKISANNNK